MVFVVVSHLGGRDTVVCCVCHEILAYLGGNVGVEESWVGLDGIISPLKGEVVWVAVGQAVEGVSEDVRAGTEGLAGSPDELEVLTGLTNGVVLVVDSCEEDGVEARETRESCVSISVAEGICF